MASGEGRGLEGSWLTKIRRTIHLYNMYGRIVTKKSKGCSYYYDLLNINAKTDGWCNIKLKLEIKFSEAFMQYENTELDRIICEILKTLYLKR